MNCQHCQMVSINGLACHETGCPVGPTVAKCAGCDEALRTREVWFANDWDGIQYCKTCANQAAESEAECELVDDAEP